MALLKVLWFTNNACSAQEILDPGNPRGGWLASLEKSLADKNEIELHICFYHGNSKNQFRYGNTIFHPLRRSSKKNKFSRLLGRVLAYEYDDEKDLRNIKNLVEELNPSILHIHGTEENFGLILGHTNIPVVISIQGLLNPYLEKFYVGIPKDIAKKYESLIDKLLQRSAEYTCLSFKVRADREASILKRARFLIGRTEWDKAVTRILSPESTYFIGQEALRPSFYEKNWNKVAYSGIFKLFTTTGDSLYKGFEMIVKTAQLLKQHKGFEFEWRVAGLNDRSRCVRIVKKWLQADLETINVKLLGSLSEEQLVDSLCGSDIYCQVSHIENSPNSLCEAQLVGVPIIATDVGGTKSLIQHGENGILVQDGDPYSLAGEIIQAYGSFNTYQVMSKKGKEVAIWRHGRDEIVNQYIRIYKQVIV